MKSTNARNTRQLQVDYELMFNCLPTAAAVLHDRVIVACNTLFSKMMHGNRMELLGQSFGVLYADPDDFEVRGKRVGEVLRKQGSYTDERPLRRIDGDIFWTRISGFTFDRRSPFNKAIWTFVDLSADGAVNASIRPPLTQRERDVATLLLEQLSSKEIARRLQISPRTVDIYRSNLLRKYGVASTSELVVNLLRLKLPRDAHFSLFVSETGSHTTRPCRPTSQRR